MHVSPPNFKKALHLFDWDSIETKRVYLILQALVGALPGYCYSPSGVKERTGLVSLLLSLLASLLQP